MPISRFSSTRHAAENATSFGNQGDAGAQIAFGAVGLEDAALEADLALIGKEAGDGAGDGGFAGAIGADQCHDFLRANVDIDAAHRGDAAIAYLEIADLEHQSPRPR